MRITEKAKKSVRRSPGNTYRLKISIKAVKGNSELIKQYRKRLRLKSGLLYVYKIVFIYI